MATFRFIEVKEQFYRIRFGGFETSEFRESRNCLNPMSVGVIMVDQWIEAGDHQIV
jgi:hypothetical protein